MLLVVLFVYYLFVLSDLFVWFDCDLLCFMVC